MDDSELRQMAADIASLRVDIVFLRAAVEQVLPLLDVLRGNGQVDAVRAAGMRRALRKGTR